jgi:hypothetical protein
VRQKWCGCGKLHGTDRGNDFCGGRNSVPPAHALRKCKVALGSEHLRIDPTKPAVSLVFPRFRADAAISEALAASLKPIPSRNWMRSLSRLSRSAFTVIGGHSVAE